VGLRDGRIESDAAGRSAAALGADAERDVGIDDDDQIYGDGPAIASCLTAGCATQARAPEPVPPTVLSAHGAAC
jgi:hypothetical protein